MPVAFLSSSRLPKPLFRTACMVGVALVALVVNPLSISVASAQGTPLKPPVALKPPTAVTAPLAAPVNAPAASAPAAQATSSSTSSPLQGVTATRAALPALTRFKKLKVDGKLIDLTALPDSAVLKGKSGKTISVARIKQLQARIDGASTGPLMVAKRGQSLKTLATAPAGTRIALPGGKVARTQDLAKVQTIYAKLSVKRVITPAPLSQASASPQAIVGQNGLTLADAMKRPAGEMIQVGSRKYTAEQLRTMDAKLKASPREPVGLLDRAKNAKTIKPLAPAGNKLPTTKSLGGK